MAENSAISWTHHTFNPWWGCVRVSEACRNCYAETFDHRLGGDHWGPNARRRFFGEKHWNEPLRWNERAAAAGERQRVFCASMADVFEKLPNDHPDALEMERARQSLFRLIDLTPALDWLLLTKRPENIAPWLWPAGIGAESLPANVWIGTTVEDQEQAGKRLPQILEVPAAVRFVSAEPLLGPLDLRRYLGCWYRLPCERHSRFELECLDCAASEPQRANSIHWVIAGGESGHGARPTNPDWFRSLRDQCQETGIAFHFKQWGDLRPTARGMDPRSMFAAVHGIEFERVGAKAAGRLLDGRTWDEFPAEATC